MLSLIINNINNKKCLILNLSEEPNFVVAFLLKSYTTFMRLTSFVNLSKKTALLLHGNDFRTRHQVLTRLFFSPVTVTV